MKTCIKCKVPKPLENFHVNNRNDDKRENTCALCRNKGTRKCRTCGCEFQRSEFMEDGKLRLNCTKCRANPKPMVTKPHGPKVHPAVNAFLYGVGR